MIIQLERSPKQKMKEDGNNQLNFSKIKLIKDVKSLLIFRKIFSFLNIKLKLKIITYNKSIKKN